MAVSSATFEVCREKKKKKAKIKKAALGNNGLESSAEIQTNWANPAAARVTKGLSSFV